MHIFRPSLKHLYSFKRIGQKLWEELRGQGTCSLYTPVVLELKKCLSKKCGKSNKNYFRILKKPHAYLQAILKAHVKFQKDRPKTVGGVKGTRYLLPIHFCSIRNRKMTKLKMRKK